MRTVTLFMTDELTGSPVERTIDISNVMVPNTKAPLDFEHDVIGNMEQQRKRLNSWITERGNDQHNTLLRLDSWTINQ